MQKKVAQDIIQIYNYLVLLQTKQAIDDVKAYQTFCYNLYLLATYHTQAISNLSAFGQTTSATFANGVHTATGVDSAGYVSGITSVPSYGAKVQELAYTYDGLGSVLTRKDKSVTGKYINETFTYDKMDRLYSLRTASNVAGSYIKNKDYRYNRLGNITYQSGIGSYSYHTNKPHAVKTAGTRNYTYDTTGNMISS